MKVDEYRKRFDEALENDLNMPQALAVVWEVVKSNIPSADKHELLISFDEVLGLDLRGAVVGVQEADIPKQIEKLVGRREQLRKEGKFAEADKVRREIEAKGFTVEDTSTGSKVLPV